MADKYVDGQSDNATQDGDSWATAYWSEANIQGAYDQLVAGNTLHCTRTQTLTAKIDIDTNQGTVGNMITVQGYNYNGGGPGVPVVDGTRYVIDANGAAANCINVANIDFWQFNDVEFKNATGDNVVNSGASCVGWVFKNCISHDAGGGGWGDSTSLRFLRSTFILCQAYNNANDGFACDDYNSFLFCTAHTNGGVGTSFGFFAKTSTYIGCVAYNNSKTNFSDLGFTSLWFGCVSDDPTDFGLSISNYTAVIAGCRVTGVGTGIVGDGSAYALDLWNFINTPTKTATITVDQQINGADTRTETGVEGYVDAASGLYSLILGAAGYRTEVDMGGGNYARIARGLPTSILPRIGEI